MDLLNELVDGVAQKGRRVVVSESFSDVKTVVEFDDNGNFLFDDGDRITFIVDRRQGFNCPHVGHLCASTTSGLG